MEVVVYFDGNEVVEEEVDQCYIICIYIEKVLDFIDQKVGLFFFLYVAYFMLYVFLYVFEDFEGKSFWGLYGDVIEEIDWSVG